MLNFLIIYQYLNDTPTLINYIHGSEVYKEVFTVASAVMQPKG